MHVQHYNAERQQERAGEINSDRIASALSEYREFLFVVVLQGHEGAGEGAAPPLLHEGHLAGAALEAIAEKAAHQGDAAAHADAFGIARAGLEEKAKNGV